MGTAWLLILTIFVHTPNSAPATIHSFRLVVQSQETCHQIAKSHSVPVDGKKMGESTAEVVYSCTPVRGQITL